MSNDDIYALIDETANMLRGMTLDPAIPQHAKSAMWALIQTLDEALEKQEEKSRIKTEQPNAAHISPSELAAGLAADSKRALELLGSIFYCGKFVAETSNERELEILMRKRGYFIETEHQFDAYCRMVHEGG